MAKEPITPAALNRLLRYEPETGRLFWRERPVDLFKSLRSCNSWNARYAHKEAFTTTIGAGYRQGGIFDRVYYAHRVAWAIYHGVWPDDDVDHIDGDRANNRIENLRDVSRSMNLRNAKMRCDNSSGANGVDWRRDIGKWRARVEVDGQEITLGYFTDLAAASTARKDAENGLGFTDRHGTPSTPATTSR